MKVLKNKNIEQSFSVSNLARICGVRLKVSSDIEIKNITSIQDSKKGDITFINNPKYYKYLPNCKASACIIKPELVNKLNKNVIALECKDPYLVYAKILDVFYKKNKFIAYHSSLASISSGSNIDNDTCIEAFVNISEDAIILANCFIGSNSKIGPNVKIGFNTFIGSNVVISNSIIGNNVNIQSGTKIGQDGFGFVMSDKGHTKVPQVGIVKIGNNVDIGANCTIDRGSLESTDISDGVKIDSQVHIAHNVKVGKMSVIAGQTGIAGSTIIGKFVIIGGQVGIAGHLNIGDGAQIGAQSGVTKDVLAGNKVSGTPAVSLGTYLRQSLKLKNLVKYKL